MRQKESSNFLKVLIITFIAKHNLVFDFHSIFILSEQNNLFIILLNDWIYTSKQAHVIVFFNFVNFFRKFLNCLVKFLLSFDNLSFNHVSFFPVLLFSFIDYIVNHFRPSIDFSN